MIKRLFLDLETSPNICYTWRIGQKINLGHNFILKERAIICACYKWQHEKKVHFVEWKAGDDKRVVKEMMSIMDQADEVIGHNSDRFDIPWVNTRAIKHGIKPVSNYKKVDTLKMARKNFNFNNNKLDYLSQFLLGDEKIDTGGFDLWKSVMDGDESAMAKMVKYCKKDVVLLERVYNKLLSYSDNAIHQGVSDGHGRWSCPECGSERVKKNKNRISSKGIKTHEMKCHDCNKFYGIAGNVYTEYMERFDNLKNGV
jgi:regulator of sigma D